MKARDCVSMPVFGNVSARGAAAKTTAVEVTVEPRTSSVEEVVVDASVVDGALGGRRVVVVAGAAVVVVVVSGTAIVVVTGTVVVVVSEADVVVVVSGTVVVVVVS